VIDDERLRLTVLGPEELVVELDPGVRDPGTDDPATDEPAGPPGKKPRQRSSPPYPEVRALRPSASERADRQARYEVTVDGWVLQVRAESASRADLRERTGRAASAGHGHVRQVVRAQIPGRVVRVWVAVGQQVEAGERLLAVEAMKMENEVRAPRAGTVESIGATVGATVELGDELAAIG
jgi:biotin carboxyl carrier protein